MATPPLSRPTITHSRVRGVTIIEIAVVLTLMGILVAIAAPSFRNIFDSFRVDAARDTLLSSIQYARTEAIRTGQAISIQRKTNCTNNNWSCGWVIFRDINGDNSQQANEQTIRDIEPTVGVNIRTNTNATTNRLQINNFGQFGTNIFFSFTIAPETQQDSSRCIRIAYSAGMRATSTKNIQNCS